MVDGASVLAQMVWSMRGAGAWRDERGVNLLDGGAPFYDTSTCADGRHVAVAAIEPRFYAATVSGLGLNPADLPAQKDRDGWPTLRATFTATFLEHPSDYWSKIFADVDTRITPVLSFEEASVHPHLAERGTITSIGGIKQAVPTPRFSRTVPGTPTAPPAPDCASDVSAILTEWQA